MRFVYLALFEGQGRIEFAMIVTMKRTVFYELASQSESDMSPGGETPTSGQIKVFPPTYLVVRFARHLHPETLAWFIAKIRGRRKDGGAEILVRRHPTTSFTKGTTIHLSMRLERVLEVAEEMELCKADVGGLIREFVLHQLDDFLVDDMAPDGLFTSAERQTIVRHELENVRAGPGESYLPSHSSIKLYPGQSIFQVLTRHGFVEKCYPLHDTENLKKLGNRWYLSLFKNQPYEEIRLYYGENVALYFIFLGFYTTALLPPMCIGLLDLFIPQTTTVFFCLFNVLWVILFLELWRRKSSELAFKWGTIGMTSLDEPRCEFRGVMGLDPVTGRYQPKYPRWKTNLKMYCVSLPVVFVCVLIAFAIMLVSFWLEALAIEDRREAGDESYYATAFVMVPSVVYTALVYVMNLFYRSLATYLTEWENHRTQSQFERHRVTKLVIFEFINNFMSLFYIAFIMQDLDMLKTQLATMLIILQAINNLQETLFPLLVRNYGKRISNYLKSRRKNVPEKAKDNFEKNTEEFLCDVPKLEEDDDRVVQAMSEARMDPYEAYDDYLELFIQFGYVFLFSSVYPIAAIWAVLNNVLEIRSDAFKLCKVCQRPMSRRVKDIGAWQRAFDAVGALSILTNCGLMCISPQLRSLAPNTSEVEWVLLFLAIEHVLLAARYLLNETIPDRPEWVRVAMAKINHQSKQALKHERALKRGQM